jgi:hypothetical protein
MSERVLTEIERKRYIAEWKQGGVHNKSIGFIHVTAAHDLKDFEATIRDREQRIGQVWETCSALTWQKQGGIDALRECLQELRNVHERGGQLWEALETAARWEVEVVRSVHNARSSQQRLANELEAARERIAELKSMLCICAEWDGKGKSTCGLTCPIHGIAQPKGGEDDADNTRKC